MSCRLSSNLSQSHIGMYTMITREKEIENDRERIIKRFNFSQNKTIEGASSTEAKKKTPRPPHPPNTRNKHMKPFESQSISLQTKNLTSHCVMSKDITGKTNQSSHNTILSDDTEKETKSRLVLIKDKIINENLYGNGSFNENEGVDAISNQIEFQPGVNYLPLSHEESSNKSSSYSRQENTQNNVLIKRYDHERIRFIDINQAKTKKIKQLFFSHPSYDISHRLINDEISNFHNKRDESKRFRFIKDIQQSNDKIRKIKLDCLLKLSDCAIYNLLSFCYESFDILTQSPNQIIAAKVYLSLNNIFNSVINSFKLKYANVIQLEAFSFKQKTFRSSKSVFPILDLVLKVKVITKDINKSYEIGYSYLNDKGVYHCKWKFDVKLRGDYTMWLASEFEIQPKANRFCYSQPVGQFSCNDIIEFRMNLFSKQFTLNPFSIKWEGLNVTEASKGFYQKAVLKCPIAFDIFYSCEIENMVHIWRGLNVKVDSTIAIFRRFFSKHFCFGEILFDASKIRFFKISLTAVSEGRIKRNQYINFDIEIIAKDKPLKNEIQPLGLLNSTLLSDCIQIAKGTHVIFYLTEAISD